MSRVERWLILLISQGAYAGKVPIAPGTVGTVVGVLLYLWMRALSPIQYLSLCVLICLIGIWTAGRAESILGRKDSPTIVIDEIAGYVVAMFMVPPTWGYVVAGFILFRAFDIVKPFPLRRLENFHGGFGVMLDDIGAGVYTNLVLQIAAYFKIL